MTGDSPEFKGYRPIMPIKEEYYNNENPWPTQLGERKTGSYYEQGPEHDRPFTPRERRRLILWGVICAALFLLVFWSVSHK